MNLVLDQILPATPEAVWPALTEPMLIQGWSPVTVQSLALGDADDAGGVGALWQGHLRLPGLDRPFLLVIEQTEPPRRLIFRIIEGPSLRYHRGELLLTAQGPREAHLLMELSWDLGSWALEQGTRVLLKSQLQRGLTRLCTSLRGAPRRDYPAPRRLDESAEVPALRAVAEQGLAEHRALSDRLERSGDPRHLFSRLSQYAGEALLAACRAGLFVHPAWVLRIVPRFVAIFRDNLRRYLGEAPGLPESHWRAAFATMEGEERMPWRLPHWPLPSRSTLLLGLMAAVQAHIEEDLPRVLADVYVTHYASGGRVPGSPRCSYARFRSDYLLSARVMRDAAERLAERLPLLLRRPYLGILDNLMAPPGNPPPRRGYSVPLQRLHAFERGERLVALLLKDRAAGAVAP